MKLPKFLFNIVSKHKTSLGNNEAFPPEEKYDFDYRILKERFNEVIGNSKEFYDGSDDSTNIGNSLNKLIKECKEIESNNRDNLINLCVKIVNDVLQIPEETVILDCKLVDVIKPKNKFRTMPEDNYDRTGYDFEDLIDIENFNKVILKRRLINSLVQGASYRCCELYKNYIDEISSIDKRLPNIYKDIIRLNDLLLFIREEKISDDKPMQGSCVEVILGRSDEKSEIYSQGLIFPFLLNETFRGFFELFASHGLPKDFKKANFIIKQADFLLAEPWDLRMGVKLWDLIIDSNSETKLFPYFFSNLCELSTDDFNGTLKEVFAKTKKGKNIISDMLDDANHEYGMLDLKNTINAKNSEENLLNDSYLSIDDLDAYRIDDECSSGIIEEEGSNIDYASIAKDCDIDDIELQEEELDIPQFQIHVYINGIEFPEELINLKLEPRTVYTKSGVEELNQIHIFLDESIKHIGLGFKLYCKSIITYGNVYSGKGRVMNNNEIPKIWNKLKNEFNVSYVDNINGQCVGIKAEF